MDAMVLPIFSSLHNEISDDVDAFWVCSADDNLVRAWYSRLSPLNCHPLCKLIAPFIVSNILAFDGGETIRTAMLSLLAAFYSKVACVWSIRSVLMELTITRTSTSVEQRAVNNKNILA